MFNKNKTLSTLKFLSYGTAFSFLSFLSFNAFFPAVPSNAATQASATSELELEIEPTIEVAVDTQSLNLAYNGDTDVLPTSEGVTATGDINVYVTTNGISGYTLSLYTQNPTNEMKNVNSAVSTTIAPTIGGSTLANNTWGFQYDGGNWTPVSDDASNPSVLINTNNATNSLCNDLATNYASCYTNNSADKATVTFGANITDTLPAGRYTNDVVFSAIAKSPSAKHAYSITYDKNNASAEGSATSTTALYPGTTTLSDGTGLTLEGMRIAGWAFTAEATTVAEVGSSNTPLTAGATDIETSDLITAAAAAGQSVSEDTSGKITLYAVWELDGYGEDTMQGWTGCSTLATNASVELTDVRDEKTYTVKKLPDGKCWMMQNLTINGVELTPADTNIADGNTYYLPKDGGAGSLTSASTKDATTGYNFASGSDNQAMFKFRSKNTSYTNDSDTGYYNFYTATLGYSYYNDGKTSGTSPQDICPANWRMPRTTDSGTNVTAIDTTNDFTYLARTYSTSNWSGSSTGTSGYGYYSTNSTLRTSINQGAASPLATATANNYAGFSYAGYWNGTNSSASDVGSYGYYWSASIYSTNYGYYLYFSSSGVYPQDNNDKYRGYAVRCLQSS